MDPTSTTTTVATTASTTGTPPLSDGGAVFESFGWFVEQTVNMIDLVTANPVLCLGLAMWAVGATIGLFKRLV